MLTITIIVDHKNEEGPVGVDVKYKSSDDGACQHELEVLDLIKFALDTYAGKESPPIKSVTEH